MKEIYETECEDRNGLRNSISLAMELPKLLKASGSIRKGSVTITSSIGKAGAVLDSGTLADLIYALTAARQELLENEYKQRTGLEAKREFKKIWEK